jgi:hypothetical protein
MAAQRIKEPSKSRVVYEKHNFEFFTVASQSTAATWARLAVGLDTEGSFASHQTINGRKNFEIKFSASWRRRRQLGQVHIRDGSMHGSIHRDKRKILSSTWAT